EREPVNHWMVMDILQTNAGRLPAYLAVTVPDHHGLERSLVLEGLAYRITPSPVRADSGLAHSGHTWVDETKLRRRLDRDYSYRGLYDAAGHALVRPYKDDDARSE